MGVCLDQVQRDELHNGVDVFAVAVPTGALAIASVAFIRQVDVVHVAFVARVADVFGEAVAVAVVATAARQAVVVLRDLAPDRDRERQR